MNKKLKLKIIYKDNGIKERKVRRMEKWKRLYYVGEVKRHV
jgi:hypothetical protein